MKKNFLLATGVAAIFAFSSCKKDDAGTPAPNNPGVTKQLKKVTKTEAGTVTVFNLTYDVLKAVWLTNFMQAKGGQKPVVICGLVDNKSHEHIEAETFVKDLEQAFIKTQKVRVVQAGKKREELRAEKADQQTNATASTMKKFGMEVGADYILQGSINSIVDEHKKKRVVYYQVNLELTDIQTNEVVWIGDKKIAKYVKN